jgi:hypothetical protein
MESLPVGLAKVNAIPLVSLLLRAPEQGVVALCKTRREAAEQAICHKNGHAAASTIQLTKKPRIRNALGWSHPARFYPGLSLSLSAVRGKSKTIATGYGPTVSVTLVGL